MEKPPIENIKNTAKIKKVEPKSKKKDWESYVYADDEEKEPWANDLIKDALQKNKGLKNRAVLKKAKDIEINEIKVKDKEVSTLLKLELKAQRGELLSQAEAGELRRYKERQKQHKELRPETEEKKSASEKIDVVLEEKNLVGAEKEVPVPVDSKILELKELKSPAEKEEKIIPAEEPVIKSVHDEVEKGEDRTIRLTAEDKFAVMEFGNLQNYLKDLYKNWYQVLAQKERTSKELREEIEDARAEIIEAHKTKIKEEYGGKRINSKKLDEELRKRVGPVFEQIKNQAKNEVEGRKTEDKPAITGNMENLINKEKLEKLEKFSKEFYQALEQGASWDGYSEEDKILTLKIQTKTFLNKQLERLKLVEDDKIAEVVEFLINKINEK